MTEKKASNPTANTHSKRVGRRLAIIREELSRFHGEHTWSQVQVAQRVSLTQNKIHRMETGKGGPVESWLKVIALYEAEGYNLNWILTEKNSLISKLQFQDVTQDGAGSMRAVILARLEQCQATHDNEMAELRNLLLSNQANW